MVIQTREIDVYQYEDIISREESHFLDYKSADISPSSLTKTVSAFANSGGGEIYIGIEEIDTLNSVERKWIGFENQEAANPIFQVLEKMTPLGDHYNAEFIYNLNAKGMALHLTIFKVQEIMKSSNGRVYVRRGAQNLPLEDEAALERLRFDKGLKSFEGTILNDVDKNEISNSITVLEFLMENMDSIEPSAWLLKQRVMLGDRPTVAGVLLYSDLPQTILPKRSSVKILRYQTKGQGERDSMMNDPVTIEGPIYNLVYDAVDKCKEIVEKIERLGLNGLEKVVYPEEALHEIVTNAVLHRDYSIATDVQIRIFDNRIEIESPGKLPGHVTVKNISTTQFSRNPQIVRLINKFKNPPNKDVGEGWNTAAEAMGKLRLKEPVLLELENSVLVILKHENLGSPEQLVMEYLKAHDEITNSIARDLTAIRSENTMKEVFYRLRDRDQIEQIPGRLGNKSAWRKKTT